MLCVNLNSRIINPAPVTADRGGTVDLYWQGFNNFCAGQTLAQQATFNESNGWWWGLHCEAEANTPQKQDPNHAKI
jgi:hypothetical protein